MKVAVESVESLEKSKTTFLQAKVNIHIVRRQCQVQSKLLRRLRHCNARLTKKNERLRT